MTTRSLGIVLLVAGLASACTSEPPSAPLVAATPPQAQRCEGLAQQAGLAIGERSARVVSATLNAAAAAKGVGFGAVPATPAHCEVIGAIRERTGTDGQRYAVKFHLRLPTEWNGRFLFEGSGGTAGNIGNATGGLDQGYAVVSTDTGHDNATNNDPARQGQVSFAHDYEARLEYSGKSLDSVATVAKKLVSTYYGRAIDRSYFNGCSNGGREGMVFAQRYPEQFDGILAKAPAFAVPKAAIAEANDTKAFAKVAFAEKFVTNGVPDLSRTFSAADFDLVAGAIAKACDADDGVADGMVQDFTKCTAARVRPALNAKLCTGKKAEGCISSLQIEALTQSMEGPRNSKGEALYASWPWDVGIANGGWRIWKIGANGGPAVNITLGAPALSALFVTPPETLPDNIDAYTRYHLDFSFDRDAPKIFGTNAQFPRSGWDVVGAQSTDLTLFRAHGGKIIAPHGVSDPIFSISDTIDWWKGVDSATGGKAADFVRVFAVPGMTHCGGGPATDQYDALGALVNWVEKNEAPDMMLAKAGNGSPWPGRTRPLCVYPAVARYKGGDIERAESFACEK